MTNRYLVMTAAAALAGTAVLTGTPVGAATLAHDIGTDGTWGKAIEVPGTATLNTGGSANVESVSCASAGDCSAGGFYSVGFKNEAFVVNQASGSWGNAEEVPGTATLNAGGAADVDSVSCATAGDCSAGGGYADKSGHGQALVVSQVNGTWGSAKEVPGFAALNVGGQAETVSVSCASAGNCSAGGYYTSTKAGQESAFVVSQVNGTWGNAKEVPGIATLNTGGGAAIVSVSCGSAGNCSAGGYYETKTAQEAFVVSQVNGTWGQAKEVPGTATLNTGGGAKVQSVSCATAGNCSAGGYYTNKSGTQPFVVSQVNGTWGNAEEVPGTATLNAGGRSIAVSVSCATAGNCSAGGEYTDKSGNQQVFVVSQVGGIWGNAEEVPGAATLNTGGSADVESVSCATAGNCSAGGYYSVGSPINTQAFVVSQVNGTWGNAEEVPGTAALNNGLSAFVESVSCASPSHCGAGGFYTDKSSHGQAFVVSKT